MSKCCEAISCSLHETALGAYRHGHLSAWLASVDKLDYSKNPWCFSPIINFTRGGLSHWVRFFSLGSIIKCSCFYTTDNMPNNSEDRAWKFHIVWLKISPWSESCGHDTMSGIILTSQLHLAASHELYASRPLFPLTMNLDWRPLYVFTCIVSTVRCLVNIGFNLHII